MLIYILNDHKILKIYAIYVRRKDDDDQTRKDTTNSIVWHDIYLGSLSMFSNWWIFNKRQFWKFDQS